MRCLTGLDGANVTDAVFDLPRLDALEETEYCIKLRVLTSSSRAEDCML